MKKIIKENDIRYIEYYIKNYPDWSIEKCKDAVKHVNKSFNYRCIEYYERKYPDLSHEEHMQMLKDKLNKQKQNDPQQLHYWINKYPNKTYEECKNILYNFMRQRNVLCIEYYERKYPDLSHEEHMQMLKDQLLYANTYNKNYGEKNGMHHSKTSEHKRRSISPRCIEFYETRFPEASHEEHEQMLANYFEYNKECVKNAVKDTNIEFYINKGMSKKEAEKALKERQTTFSLEKCIAKYGEIEGRKRFKERQEKWKQSLRENFEEYGDGRSIQSQAAHHIIQVLCERLNINYPEKEMILFNKDGNAYAYDFTYKNKIIEYNGDYWHCNPKKYNANYYRRVGNCTAQDIWDRDADKIALAKSKGYDVLSVWEMDYKENPNAIIEQCYNFVIS